MTRRFAAVGIACLLLRIALLPAWGTFDIEIYKAWSVRAVTDGIADIYGPDDAALIAAARARGTLDVPRTRFVWGTAEYFVDYPPGSVLVQWAAGRLWSFFSPALENRRGFNAAINLAPLVGSLVIALALRRSTKGALGESRALAFWANPAMLLAAPALGYQDTVFGSLAVLAMVQLVERRYAVAGALVIAAGLTKPQGALLLPTLLVVLAREASPRDWARTAAAGAAAAAAVLAPWWSSAHLLSALNGCRTPLTQPTLAPFGLNVWWIAGYCVDLARSGKLGLARIWTIEEFAKAAFDARPWATGLLLLSTLANALVLVRGLTRERALAIPLSLVLQVHAYALVGLRVHENHTLLALMVLPLAVGLWRRATAALVLTSAFAFLSLFFSAGLGRRVTRLAEIAAVRSWTGVDASVLTAFGHIALVAALCYWTFAATKER